MKKLTLCVVAFLLTIGSVWAQSDFEAKAKRNFSASILDSVQMDNGKGEIVFKDNQKMPSYFRTGDKINKIFAIESARLFRDVADLQALTMTIPLQEKTHFMSISREAINKFYGLDFAAMKGNPDAWRSEFIRKYDSKKSRAAFAAEFVKSE